MQAAVITLTLTLGPSSRVRGESRRLLSMISIAAAPHGSDDVTRTSVARLKIYLISPLSFPQPSRAHDSLFHLCV